MSVETCANSVLRSCRNYGKRPWFSALALVCLASLDVLGLDLREVDVGVSS